MYKKTKKTNTIIINNASVAKKYRPTKYLIFDFDGVIGDTLGAFTKAYQELYAPTLSIAEITQKHFVDYHQSPKHLEYNEQEIAQEKHRRIELSEKAIQNDFNLFGSMVEELYKLRNIKMAIVSGASEKLLQFGISKANTELNSLKFDYVLGCETDLSKQTRVLDVCQNWGIDPQEAYFFTDTKTDVIELENILDKEKIFGCSWGWHGYMRLKEVLPVDQVLEEAFEIHRAIENDDTPAEEKFYKNVEKNERKARLAEEYRLRQIKKQEEQAKLQAEAMSTGAILDNEGNYILPQKTEEEIFDKEFDADFDNEFEGYAFDEEMEDEDVYEEVETTIELDKKYTLLDSTGIRRPGQRTFGAESFATFRTIEEAYQADVICMVVDGSQPLSHQDQVVAGIVQQAKKGVVVIVNKADLVEDEAKTFFQKEFEHKFQFLKIKKFIWVSAKDHTGITDIWDTIDYALEERQMDISREELRKLFNYLMKQKPPKKLRLEKRPVVYDLLYNNAKTPTFELLVKNKQTIHWSYLRFLENIIRRNFGFENTDIKVKAVNVSRKQVMA
jgi:phosphoglycolate phosphatase-like HAD superfamily hydrolase